MVKFFYRTVLSLLNQHLPLWSRTQNLTDKPLVTEEFLRKIRWRQYVAWLNTALRLSKILRRRLYNAEVKHLRQSDRINWWRQMKRFYELSGLANSVADGDVSKLADMIDVSLKRVSDDLQPFSEETA